jgi:hypothetical protein
MRRDEHVRTWPLARRAGAFAGVAGLWLTLGPGGAALAQDRGQCVVLAETFEGGALSPDRWLFTSASDLREKHHQVARRDRGGSLNHELRLFAGTGGTNDRTASYVGVVHPRPFDLREPHEIEFQLDWDQQADATDLTAGAYLVPVLTWEAPELEPDWLKFEYVGVAAGRGARAMLALRRQGRLHVIESEAGPAPPRTGQQRIRLELRRGRLRVFENGVLWHEARELELSFKSAYLYLQMSSRGERTRGEVFFDDIAVRRPCRTASGRAALIGGWR